MKLELTDEQVLRFCRFTITESAASTFTQQILDTQLSIERGVIWLIHAVDWLMLGGELEAPGAGAAETFQAQITRESKAAIIFPSDADLIDYHSQYIKRSAAIGTDAGPLWWYEQNAMKRHDYALPIPYAAQNIYLALQSTNASSPATIYGRIHYTIRKVNDAYFYRVAQALVG